MDKKTFEPKRYGMAICPCCNSHGYIQNPERKCCPKCGGFGFVKREPEEDTHTSPNWKGERRHPTMKEGDIYESLLDGTEYGR